MKKYTLMIILFLSAISIFSFDILDPDSSLYKNIEIWSNKGYIENLPPQKPYPVQYLTKLLNNVIRNGNVNNRKIAEDFLNKISKKDFKIEGLAQLYTENSSKVTMSGGLIGAQGYLSDYVHAVAEFGVFINNDPSATPFPQGKNYLQDYFIDESDLGSFQILSTFDSNISFGTDTLWLQMGLLRNSFGPFFGENIFYSPYSSQAGQISLVWNTKKFTYTNSLSLLTATKEKVKEDDGTILKYPEKFLIMRGYNYSPVSWLELGLIESIIFGERIEGMYLLPLTMLQFAQGQIGFYDNYILGFTSHLKLPKNIALKSGIYIDDIHFNDILRLEFDTKLKIAMQHELSWTPDTGLLTMIKGTYQLVTPYMYTHNPYSDTNDSDLLNTVNYLSYTNNGVSLGATLEPNSDRVRLDVGFKLPFDINMNIFGSFARHGNVSAIMTKTIEITADNITSFLNEADLTAGDSIEVIVDNEGKYVMQSKKDDDDKYYITVDGNYIKDGSILDHGYVLTRPYDDYWKNLAQRDNPFLDQDVIENTIQGGISLNKTFNAFNNPLTAIVEYTLQYIENYETVKDETDLKHYFGFSLKYTL